MGGPVVLLGFGLAIWWGTATYLEMVDDLARLHRIRIPSARVVVLDEGTQILSVESGRLATFTDLRFAVVGPDRAAVAVDPYERDLRYDVPDEPGREGRAVATFEADSPGRYTVRVAGQAAAGAILAIGEDASRAALPEILGAMALMAASLVGGAILLALRIARWGDGR
ncbi:MAG TPA: hypothetical protein VF195_07915 [Actinomycetota bacterium]